MCQESTSIFSAKSTIFARSKKKQRILTSRRNKLLFHILHNIRDSALFTRKTVSKAKRFHNGRTVSIIFTCEASPTRFYKMQNGSNSTKMFGIIREVPKYHMIMWTFRSFSIFTNSDITKIMRNV